MPQPTHEADTTDPASLPLRDNEPIVVLDDDQTGAVQPLPAWLAHRGVTSSTWCAVGADTCGDAEVRVLGFNPARFRTAHSVWLPTRDPRVPHTILGLVRLDQAQAKYRVAGQAAGVICAADALHADRLILTDNPLVGLVLRGQGAPGVLVAVDPTVLTSLAMILATKPIILVANKPHRLERLQQALGTIGTQVERVLLATDCTNINAASRATLGLPPVVITPPVPLTQRLVADLHRFAAMAIARGEGHDLLAAIGLDRPETIAAYHPGVLTQAAWRNLNEADRRTLGGHHLSEAVLIPAYDDQGAVVDIVAVQRSGRTTWSLWDAPRGRLAPTLPSAFPRLTLTDSAHRIGPAWDSAAPVLLIRGASDAHTDAARWFASGLRSVAICAHRGGQAIAAACRDVGIWIEAVSSALPPDPFAAQAAPHAGAADATDEPGAPVSVAAAPTHRAPEDVVAGAADAAASAEHHDQQAEPSQSPVADMASAAESTAPTLHAVAAAPTGTVAASPPIAAHSDAAVIATATSETPRPIISMPMRAMASPEQTGAAMGGGDASAGQGGESQGAAVRLVKHDPASEQAVFAAGSLTFTIRLPVGQTMVCAVRAVRGQATHQDNSTDLSAVPQRLRFAKVAASRLGVPSADIANALAEIATMVRSLLRPAITAGPAVATPTPAVDPVVVAEAEVLLSDPDLLGRASADLTALGWAADRDRHAVALLGAISRLSDDPLWVGLSGLSCAAASPMLRVLATITPPEHHVHVGLLSDAALLHTRDLRHRLLLLDDGAALPPTVVTALGLLRTRGTIAAAVVQRGQHGRTETVVRETEGPIAVLAVAHDGVPTRIRQHLCDLAVDGPATTDGHRASLQQRWTAPDDPAARAAIIVRWQTAQRLLQPARVIIPGAGDLVEPAVNGDLLMSWWRLIAASALLHQRQRQRGVGTVIASEADIACARRLLPIIAASQTQGLPIRAHRLLDAIRASGLATVEMTHLHRLLPSWAHMTVRRAVDDVLRLGFMRQTTGRQGQRCAWTLNDLTCLTEPLAATGTDDDQPELSHFTTPSQRGW